MAKRKQAAEAVREHPWKSTVVVAAIVTTIGGVAAQAIATYGESNDTATSTDESESGKLSVSTFRSKSVEPPPKLALTFEGTANGLTVGDLVFVLGNFNGSADGPYEISPPATYGAGDSWTVEWVLPEPPDTASYAAVVARRVEQQGAPLFDPTRLRLQFHGPDASNVSDSVEVNQEPD